MNAFEAYAMHLAIKLHFDSPTYDYFKYQGKTRASVEAFEKNKQRFSYAKLAKKYNDVEMPLFLASASLIGKKWVGDLFDQETQSHYQLRSKVSQAFSRYFKEDLNKMIDLYKEETKKKKAIAKALVETPELPKAFQLYMEGEIHTETLIGLDSFGHIFDSWKKSCDDIVMLPAVIRLQKYGQFLNIDPVKCRELFENAAI